MSLRIFLKNAEGKPCCPTHVLLGAPVVLTYIEQASGERQERWRCPVDDEELVASDGR